MTIRFVVEVVGVAVVTLAEVLVLDAARVHPDTLSSILQ